MTLPRLNSILNRTSEGMSYTLSMVQKNTVDVMKNGDDDVTFIIVIITGFHHRAAQLIVIVMKNILYY